MIPSYIFFFCLGIFFRFMPVANRDSAYQANMHSMSLYIPLGEVSYRREDPSLNVDKKVRKDIFRKCNASIEQSIHEGK